MDVFDKIIKEHSWRFSKGYPDINIQEDKDMLFSIVKSMVGEQEEESNEENPQDKETNTISINNSDSLYKLLTTKYAVAGQDIYNVDNFYNSIIKSSNSNQILSLIEKGGNKKLANGRYAIKGLEKELYDIIMATIKIPNGEPSELWVAIMYKGEIKGGVAGETGITSDVDINNQGVSLKNYASLGVLDFGSLGKTVEELLRDSINLFQILTGAKVKKTLTRSSINGVLDMITSEEVKKDIEEIINMAQNTRVKTITRLATQIQDNLEGDNPDSIAEKFCSGIDRNIADKLNEVDWWITINKGIVYTESSSELFEKLKCTSKNRLSNGVSNFKDLHLFVNGNFLYKTITDLDTKENV